MTSINKTKKYLMNFFNPSIATKELLEEVKDHRKRIALLKKEYDSLSEWNSQYVATLGMLTEAIQAMVWKKDQHNRYILANPHHCRAFFGFDGSVECLQYVVGKTDTELIKELHGSNNIPNSFEKICCVSDEYCSKQTKSIHFLEAGNIGDEEILLYTIKTPQFTDSGEFVGTIGMAWDVTSRSSFLTEQLNRWIYDGLATKLIHEKTVFCYAIVPEVNQCSLFKHVCPKGRIFFIEFKKKGESQSAPQKTVQKILEGLGFEYHVCDQIGQAENVLENFLAFDE